MIGEKDIKILLEILLKTKDLHHYLKVKIKVGDLILFDYKGKINEKNLKVVLEKMKLLFWGQIKYIRVGNQMVNLEIGATKAVKSKIPLDYENKDLASKNATFDIEIKDIQERVKKSSN